MSNRRHRTRRTVLSTLGLAAVASTTTVSAAGDTAGRSNAVTDACSATRYVAVVDRIVDGEHVVLLLERDGELVDQHVEPRSELEFVEEGDILTVVLKDGDLLTARQLPKRPGRSATEDPLQDRFDSLSSEL